MSDLESEYPHEIALFVDKVILMFLIYKSIQKRPFVCTKGLLTSENE